MTGKHRQIAAGRPARCRRLTVTGAAVAVSVALSVPGAAYAFLSSTPSPRTASVAAATVASPGSFTATATGPTTADLSWSGPAAKTSYELVQSQGTLTGCSSLGAGSTGCTATGLEPDTPYTWTLNAVYNGWAGPQIQVTETTPPFAVDAGSSNAPCGLIVAANCVTGSSMSTTSGRTELIFVIASASLSFGAPTLSGPFTGAAQINTVQVPGVLTTTTHMYAFKATGNGTTGAVTATFPLALGIGATAWADVVELGAGESTVNCGGVGCTDSGSAGPANAVVATPAGAREISFLGSDNGAFGSVPSGFSLLGGSGPDGHATYADPAAQSSASFGTSPSGTHWGSISVKVTP